MTDPKPQERKNALKYVSLIVLSFQNAFLTVSMRHGRTRVSKENLFFTSTAVLMTEITKMFICLIIVFIEEKRSVKKFHTALRQTIVENKIDTLKMCVPSLLYVIQNNLLYLAVSNLDAATYLITSRLKILTTAIFTVIILRTNIRINQWTSFIILIAGIAVIQLGDENRSTTNKGNPTLGFVAVLSACTLSGFTGIFLEKMLKKPDVSLWMRNVQMSILSIPVAIATCLVSNFSNISSKGFFHGFDYFVVFIVLFQACSGLIVAIVVKYAGNILKGFAVSFSIIIASIASVYLFDFQLTKQFVIGTLLVIGATFLYSFVPKSTEIKDSTPNSNEISKDIQLNESGAKDNKAYVIELQASSS